MIKLPPPLTEAQFQRQVIDLARLRGWLVHHQRPARTARGWRTAIQGDAGFPDLVLVRDRVIFAELKRDGVPSLRPDQSRWLVSMVQSGAEVYVWRPADWPEIERVLA